MKMAAIVAAALLAMASCGTGSEADGLDAAQSGAEFRYAARQTYEALAMESCQERRALRREVVLAPERAAVRAYAARVQSQPLRAHLAVAQSDVEYLRESRMLGCWEDSDPRFAALHVQMARDTVRNFMGQMERLAPALPPLPLSDGLDVPGAPKFRSDVRELVQLLQSFCSSPAEHDPVVAPARAELAQLRQRLDGTPYALHFAVAEADALYLYSITEFECSDGPPLPSDEAKRRTLEETRRRIAPLAARAGLSTGS